MNPSQPQRRRPAASRAISIAWASYAGQVIPKSAGPDQLRDMRDTFYAGALAALLAISEAGNKGSDDAGVDHIEGIHQELAQYVADFDVPASPTGPLQ